MDPVRKTFDEWAQNGRDEIMEREHGKNVARFLKTISFEKPFSFLDVGCGNGWIVRKIAQNKNCKKAIGIDKSKKMISQANKKQESKKEKYIHTDIQSWNYTGKFDYVFSMESLYYAESIEESLGKVFKMIKPGGEFFCGTDFYKDNKATTKWAKMMKLNMHLHSKQEWKKLFKDAGFETKTKQVKDPKGNQKWKREMGTLFIIGKKPKSNLQIKSKLPIGVSWSTTSCYGRGNSSLHARNMIRRWITRDGWQRSRKNPTWSTVMVKPEIPREGMKKPSHMEQSQTEP